MFRDVEYKEGTIMEQKHSGRSSIDHLLRTTHQHHIYLSGMADKKASFLIAAASVMLTIIFSRFVDGVLVPLPLMILGGFSLVATSLAILCIMPRGQKTPDKNDAINLLFFGEFVHLSPDEYWQKMRELITDDETIYQAVSKEIYDLGQLLYQSKFKYLVWAYRVFLTGIVLTSIAVVFPLFKL